MQTNVIEQLVNKHGLKQVACICSVTYQAVLKWRVRGRLPRTEWTGETNYAGLIEKFDPEFNRKLLVPKKAVQEK